MNHPTRRTFLGTASLAATALAAPRLEPVRILVVGTGGRGSDLLRALSTIDAAEVVGIADDYPPHLEQAARYAGPQARRFADYRQALDRLKPQAVVIAVPLALHFPIATDALDAGCDVFCEKVMCFSVDQARRLAAQVAASKLIFQVGLQRRANPIYQQAAALVRSGVLGPISAIQARWHRNNNWRRPVPVPRSDPGWPALERRLNWRLYRDSSDGLMSELGSHQLDVANWLLGVPPTRVFASGGIDFYRDGREVFDNITALYDYTLPPDPKSPDRAPRTVRVTYSSLGNNAYEGASEVVMGSRGTLVLSSTKGLLYREAGVDSVAWSAAPDATDRAASDASIIAAGKTLKLSDSPWAHRGTPVEIDNVGDDDTRAELVSFLDHVRRRDPKTLVDARAGLINTATVLIANESAREGRPVPFPDDLLGT